MAQVLGSRNSIDELLGVVEEVAPVLRRHSDESESAHRLAEPVVDAMRQAGLYRLWRPRAFGGYELNPADGFRVLEALARIDSAAGWNVQLANAADTFGAWLPDDAAEEVFGTPETILAGGFFPPRSAVAVDQGYRLSGRTPFASGVHACTWVLGQAAVIDGEAPRVDADGNPVVVITMSRAEEAEIIEHWNTMGMRGTGSHDVALTDVFVPARRAPLFVPLETPNAAFAGPMHRLSLWPAIGALSAPALGIARAALDALVEMAAVKTPNYTARTLRDRSVVQMQMAQAEAALEAGRAYYYGVLEARWERAVAGHRMSMDDRATAQLASSHAVLAAAEAVRQVHAAAGASGIREEHPFERHFRDVHTITQHGFITAARMESVGQVRLGLEPEWPFFAF